MLTDTHVELNANRAVNFYSKNHLDQLHAYKTQKVRSTAANLNVWTKEQAGYEFFNEWTIPIVAILLIAFLLFRETLSVKKEKVLIYLTLPTGITTAAAAAATTTTTTTTTTSRCTAL